MRKRNDRLPDKRPEEDSAEKPESYIFWVIALPVEARPLIQYLNLKRQMDTHCWPVYLHGRHVLIISGIGKVRAAMAVTWLAAKFNDRPLAGLINFGFCGSSDPQAKPGDIYRISEVKDMDQDRMYYPDLFESASINLRPLQCWSCPVKADMITASDTLFCDMESAGIMEAARQLFQSHQVMLFKIVSDKLDPDGLRLHVSEDTLSHWLSSGLPVLEEAVKQLDQLQKLTTVPLLEELEFFVSQVDELIPLTVSMKQQLEMKTRQLMLSRSDDMDAIYEALSIHLAVILQSPLRSKKHVKRAFDAFIAVMDDKINEHAV